MEKIKMPVPIAELDGDEMTHILWGMIKDQLIKPFVDLNTEYYDLSLPNRDKTEDAVTRQAAEAIKRLHVGVKCATLSLIHISCPRWRTWGCCHRGAPAPAGCPAPPPSAEGRSPRRSP